MSPRRRPQQLCRPVRMYRLHSRLVLGKPPGSRHQVSPRPEPGLLRSQGLLPLASNRGPRGGLLSNRSPNPEPGLLRNRRLSPGLGRPSRLHLRPGRVSNPSPGPGPLRNRRLSPGLGRPSRSHLRPGLLKNPRPSPGPGPLRIPRCMPGPGQRTGPKTVGSSRPPGMPRRTARRLRRRSQPRSRHPNRSPRLPAAGDRPRRCGWTPNWAPTAPPTSTRD
jgi:hypothetical protein